MGAAILAGLVPLALLLVRRNPESIGLRPDGAGTWNHDQEPTNRTRNRNRNLDLRVTLLREALATPAFWIFAVGAALYGLVASGIGLFNESILAERGFGPEIYYQTLVVTAITGLAGNFAGGWLARFMALNGLLAISLLVLGIGLLALPHVSSIGMAMGWATMMGLGGGLVMVLFFSVWPRIYGRVSWAASRVSRRRSPWSHQLSARCCLPQPWNAPAAMRRCSTSWPPRRRLRNRRGPGADAGNSCRKQPFPPGRIQVTSKSVC